jgi:hypothetical protein
MDSEELRDLLSKVTPGPWYLPIGVFDGNSVAIPVHAKDAEDGEDWEVAVVLPWAGPGNATASNARLIAAAPDLAAEVLALRAERDAALARAEVERLLPWAKLGAALMERWPEIGDIDGFCLQDMAVSAGVLQEVPGGYDPDEHFDIVGVGPEPGDQWFECRNIPAALRAEGGE